MKHSLSLNFDAFTLRQWRLQERKSLIQNIIGYAKFKYLKVLLGLWLKLYLGIHFVLTIGAETLARRYISLAYHQIPRRAYLKAFLACQ
jgi:hypothetical protein